MMRLISRAVTPVQPIFQPALVIRRHYAFGGYPSTRRTKAKSKKNARETTILLPERPPYKNPFELLGHATHYGAPEAENPLYPRFNPAKIQLVSSLVHKQIFPETTDSPPTPEALEVFNRVTSEQAIPLDRLVSRRQVSLPLPPQLGGDLVSHFEAMASKIYEPYLKLAQKASTEVQLPIPTVFPNGATCVSGWSRYDVETATWNAVSHPTEHVLIVTYDRIPHNDRWPLFACAGSAANVYLWVSPWLTGESDHFEHLIPFGPQDEPRLIITNDLVGLRPCVKETYNLQDSALRFLSIGSLMGPLVTNGKPFPDGKSHADYEPSTFERVYKQRFPQYEVALASDLPSTARTPAKVKAKAGKYLREVFRRARAMAYYYRVYFEPFRRSAPSLVSFAGPLRIGTAILPVDNSFEQYVARSEEASRNTLERAQSDLISIAEEARLLWTPPPADYTPGSSDTDTDNLPPQIADDEFLSRLDWTPQPAKHKSWPKEFILEQRFDSVAAFSHQDAPTSLEELAFSKIIPTQIGLRFNGHPVVYSNEHGFVYCSTELIADQQPLVFSNNTDDSRLVQASSNPDMHFYRLPSRKESGTAVRSVLNKAYLRRSVASPLSCTDPELLRLIKTDADLSLILKTVARVISSFTPLEDKVLGSILVPSLDSSPNFEDASYEYGDLRNNVTIPSRIGLSFDGHPVLYFAEHGFVYRADAPVNGLQPLQSSEDGADNDPALATPASKGYLYPMPSPIRDTKRIQSVLGAKYISRVGFDRFSCADPDLLRLIRDRADNKLIMKALERAMSTQGREDKKSREFDYPTPSDSALEADWWPKWYSDLFKHTTAKRANHLNLPISNPITPLLLRLCWKGYPMYRSSRYGWVYRVPSAIRGGVRLGESTERSEDPFSQQLRPVDVQAMRWDGYLPKKRKPKSMFFKIPSAEKAPITANDTWSKHLKGGLLTSSYPKAQTILDHLTLNSTWTSHGERAKSVVHVKASEELPMGFDRSIENGNQNGWGLVAPRISPATSMMRQAADDVWLTAPDPRSDQIGTEIKAMVKAPEGYKIVGAVVDSQSAWITSTLGDAQFGFHGATPSSRTFLNGKSKLGTDIHSYTAAVVNNQAAKVFNITEPILSREQAKEVNYRRALGGSQQVTARQIYLAMTKPDESVAMRLARWLRMKTRGWRSRASDPHLFWCEGTESFSSNSVENIAQAFEPTTPLLGVLIPANIRVSKVPRHADFKAPRINWVVKSTGADYLHCVLTSMDYLCATFDINARFMISNHDEVRYLVKEGDAYRTALALQISNLWTRALMSQRLGMDDLPQRAAFFPSIDIDTVLRVDVNNDCVTPSNPTPIPAGETVDIREILRKTNSSLRRNGPVPTSSTTDRIGGSDELERILENWKGLYADQMTPSTDIVPLPKLPSIAQANEDPDWRRYYLYAQTAKSREELRQFHKETGKPEDAILKNRTSK